MHLGQTHALLFCQIQYRQQLSHNAINWDLHNMINRAWRSKQ